MSTFIDLTGQQFGLLTVLRQAGKVRGHALWLCLCRCGIRKEISSDHLRKGRTQSCGCLVTILSRRNGYQALQRNKNKMRHRSGVSNRNRTLAMGVLKRLEGT